MPTRNRNFAHPSRDYDYPKVTPGWAEARKAHPAVAAAIHAIATSYRNAQAIWACPTPAEVGNVLLAIEDYIVQGDIEPESDCLYRWGGDSEPLVIEWP